MVPMSTPLIEPNGLNAWAKLRRRSAVSAEPHKAIKVLDAVSRKARPLAMMNRESRNSQYLATRAAGQNIKVPIPNRASPVTKPAL